MLNIKYISIQKKKKGRKQRGPKVSGSQSAGTELRPCTEEALGGTFTYKPGLALQVKEGKQV